MTIPDIFERTDILLGTDVLEKLARAHVVVAGLGGVGGHCAEALARAGIGQLTLIDNDVVTTSNINRQLIALHSTIDQPKVDVMQRRIADINPACQINPAQVFLTPDNIAHHIPDTADWVIDCIDTIPSKVALISTARQRNIPVTASMGAGNRLDPTRIRSADISQTHGCSLARIVRQQLRKAGIHQGVLTVFTDEPARPARPRQGNESRPTNGTISYMPALFGLMIAGVTLQILTSKN